ncbi:hypothetical protein [Anaerosporobacter sp.]
MRDMTRCNAKKMVAILMAATLTMASLAGCSSNKNEKVNDQTKETEAAGTSSDSTAIAMTSEEIIKKAASEGKVGNWGLGNEY